MLVILQLSVVNCGVISVGLIGASSCGGYFFMIAVGNYAAATRKPSFWSSPFTVIACTVLRDYTASCCQDKVFLR